MGENTRTALIGIIVEDAGSVEELNQLLHQYRDYIIGRMGIPHPQKSISIISIAMEADQDTVSALSGKLGALKGVSTKTIYSKRVREVVCLATLQYHDLGKILVLG